MARIRNTARLGVAGLAHLEGEAVEVLSTEPRHVGGGWYELPDGRRVKGKAAALKAMGR